MCVLLSDRRMDKIIETLSAELPQGAQAPEWIELVPAGMNVTRDGRRIGNNTPQAAIQAFEADRRDIPVDYEHATEIRPPQGLDAPAVGWIDKLELRNGALHGRVAWNDEGRRQVEGRAYRFISPVVHLDPGTRDVIRISSVSLTNDPALYLNALLRRSGEHQETIMLNAIAKALGLKEDATETEILARISENTTTTEMLKKQAAQPDAAKYVPRIDHEAVVQQCSTLRTENETLKNAETDKAITLAVEKGIADGKIIPATKDTEIEYCRAVGVEKYTERLAKLGKVISSGESETRNDPAKATGKLDEQQVEMCKRMGISEEKYLETLSKEKAA